MGLLHSCIESLGPSDASMHHYKVFVNWAPRNKLPLIFNRNLNIWIEENSFEIVVCKMSAISSRPQWAKPSLLCPWTWWTYEFPLLTKDALVLNNGNHQIDIRIIWCLKSCSIVRPLWDKVWTLLSVITTLYTNTDDLFQGPHLLTWFDFNPSMNK